MSFLLRISVCISIFFKKLIWSIPTKEKVLYLTFDDGPVPGITDKILACLKKHNVEATFFCVGHNVEKYPAIFRSVLEAGHQVGNHTFNHLDAWRVDKEGYLNNVEKCHGVLSKNGAETFLFRPPNGKLTFKLAEQLRLRGYKIVMWSLLSGDFLKSMQPKKCSRHVLRWVKNGDIIVFHDNPKTAHVTIATLEVLIPKLKEKGYLFKTL